MAAVDGESGAIIRPEIKPYGVIRKGYTWFAENDVLFAKITPCMQNGKHAVARGLIDGIGFGTTEFHVLRPTSRVSSEWIHFFVRQPQLLRDATAHFSGAVGQQRLPEDYLRELELPLPPMSEQKRIVAMLSAQMAQHDRARKLLIEQAELARALGAAYLRKLFPANLGGVTPIPSNWRAVTLGETSDIASGVTLGRRLSAMPARQVPYLRVANVKDGYLDLSEVKEIAVTDSEFSKWRLQRGDILLTEGGDRDKLGRGTYWSEQIPDCIHQNHIFRVRFDPGVALSPFVSAQLGSPYGKAYFLRHAKQTTGIASINQKVLRGFPLLLPSIAEQMRIAKQLEAQLSSAEAIAEGFRKEADALDRLPAACLYRAFAGEL